LQKKNKSKIVVLLFFSCGTMTHGLAISQGKQNNNFLGDSGYEI